MNNTSEDTNAAELLTSLVQYATLAPSSHNTQCWKFVVDAKNVSILVQPDMERRCPVVDPDDHHLYATLGCAVENVVVAAKAHGLEANVDLSRLQEDGIKISFEPCEVQESELFYAIPKRQCTRAEYDGQPLTQEELDILSKASEGNGVKALFLTQDDEIENALEYITQANAAQIDNPHFVRELVEWMRFNSSEASTKGDGLNGACVGAPLPLPRWIGKPIVRHLALKAASENVKVTKQVRSSAGLAIFVSEKDDEYHWVEAGRSYERFALQATALGVKTAFLNQPVEEASVRRELAKSLGIGELARLDFVVRFGRGEEMPRSCRRPLESVVEYQ